MASQRNSSTLGLTGVTTHHSSVMNGISSASQMSIHQPATYANGLHRGGRNERINHQSATLSPVVSVGSNNVTSNAAFLMDKLHSKANQMKNWNELSKNVKQCLLEKRPIVIDNNDRSQLQRCLDTMQNNIEVKSVQSMVDRLDTICRQLKLKFNFTKNYECFVSSDMYYVEIKLDMESGHVLDCKVSHLQDEAQVSCLCAR